MIKYTDYALTQLKKLCAIPSPSGFTAQAAEFLLNELTSLGFQPVKNTKGAVSVTLGGEGDHLVLAAHIDTLGAMVRSLKSNGRLRFTAIGGFPFQNVENENVIIHTRKGKEYTGTIHLCDPAAHVNKDVSTSPRNDQTLEVVVDEIVSSADDLKKLGISAGDFITFDPRTVITPSGFIKSRHLDDKLSAVILLALAKYIAEKEIKLTRKLTLIFTSYEEVGHGGSSGIPDDTAEMISVDMGAVGDDLTTDELKVSICAKDSSGPYDYEVTSRLIEQAEKHKLDFAVDIYPYYGSDVGATLRAGYNIKHGLIGPGVAASHGYERSHSKAVSATLKLLAAYLEII
ncbi:MAG: M42 family metallopeptidase [Candidatus Cloacimonetes bacterium]|nr:M42 family metallopeptidase [Candidatus Cloacimonadota bacterium]